jgi:hypothetical protein
MNRPAPTTRPAHHRRSGRVRVGSGIASWPAACEAEWRGRPLACWCPRRRQMLSASSATPRATTWWTEPTSCCSSMHSTDSISPSTSTAMALSASTTSSSSARTSGSRFDCWLRADKSRDRQQRTQRWRTQPLLQCRPRLNGTSECPKQMLSRSFNCQEQPRDGNRKCRGQSLDIDQADVSRASPITAAALRRIPTGFSFVPVFTQK